MPPNGALHGRDAPGLDLVVRHLWLPLVEAGAGRICLGSPTAEGWQDLHRFTALPSVTHPRLLVSQGGRRAMGRALISHGGLRSPSARAGRTLIGAAATMTGLRWARHTVTVQVRDLQRARTLEPVSRMEEVLGEPLLAVLGVREGANGKATLQLFDVDGQALGYAKVGWSALTNGYVRTETEVLRSLPSLPSGTRVPRLLAEGILEPDRPFLLTQPLPGSARTLADQDDLPTRVLSGLFPVLRHSPLRQSGQYRAVRDRLAATRSSLMRDDELGAAAHDLVRLLEGVDTPLPVMARWHGDLVPWNAARDDDGTLWLWDWESSEPDAVAGLDILHWCLSTGGGASGEDEAARLRRATHRAVAHLQALGMGPHRRAVVAAAYALTMAERHWTLAASHGSWSRNRVGREETLQILATGRSLLVSAPERG